MKNPTLYYANHTECNLRHLDTRSDGEEDMFPVYDAVEDATTAKQLMDNLNALDDKYAVHDWTVNRETAKYVRLIGSKRGGTTYFLVCEKEQPAVAPAAMAPTSLLPMFAQVPEYDGLIRSNEIVFEPHEQPSYINVRNITRIDPYPHQNYRVPEGYSIIHTTDGYSYTTDQATIDSILSLC